MPTGSTGRGSRIGSAARSRGSLPRVASLPPRVTRSRATQNSEVEAVAGPEELVRALAEPSPPAEVVIPITSPPGLRSGQQETAPNSSMEHQQLPEAQDRSTRPSDTFHTALRNDQLQMLEVNAKISAMEAELRKLRSEMRTLRAHPRTDDIIQDVRQLRIDYNSERETNSALKSELVALRLQQQRYGDILDLFRGRLERIEQSRVESPHVTVRAPVEPPVGTIDAVRPEDDRVATSTIQEGVHTSSRSKKSKKRHAYRSSSSESDSDTGESSSDSESSSDGERKHRSKSKRHGPIGRARDKKFLRLKELKPTNSLYKELLSYRHYRLNKTSQKRTTRQTAKVSSYTKRMELSLNVHKFDGSDPIKVLDFLSRFVNEANVLGMSEGQAYLALPKVLRGFARDQFEAVNHSTAASEGGVTSWPEAVQYLLRSYATGTAISEATSALRNVRQRADETETDFSTRLNVAEHRCGIVHSIEERMTYFVDGLDPAIRTLVARHRETSRHITFIELVQYAKAEGDSNRARRGPARKPIPPGAQPRALAPKDGTTKRTAALHMETTEDSTTEEYEHSQAYHDAAMLFNEHSSQSTIPTTDLSETESPYGTLDSNDPALAIGFRSQLPAPRIPYQQSSSFLAQRRPGWQVHHPPKGSGPAPQIICHLCYIRNDHIAPKCTHPWRNFAAIVHNYEALTPEERMIVPARSYNQAKTILQPSQSVAPSSNLQSHTAPAVGTALRVLQRDAKPASAPTAPKN